MLQWFSLYTSREAIARKLRNTGRIFLSRANAANTFGSLASVCNCLYLDLES